MHLTKFFVITIILAAGVGSAMTFLITNQIQGRAKTTNELIKEFYLVENAVHVSPHSIRTKMNQGGGNFVLVDLRSQEEYEREHIIGAVNIPAYADPNTPAYEDVDRIVTAFRVLIDQNPGKDIVVYCYSTPCMTGRKIGKILVERNIYVKHLGIGWNEWRYFWNLWNHDGETPTKVEDYVTRGKEPGVPKMQELPSPCGEGELSC